MANYKIIGADGKEYGPITADQLRQWVAEGRLTAQSQIQADGGEWKPLGAFPELATGVVAPAVAEAPAPAATQKTSGMAITSLVLGILGFFTCGITSPIGLILGCLGLRKINRSNAALGGKGIAIAGISISGVTLVMLPLLAALAIPGFVRAKKQSQARRIINDARQMDAAIDQWALENGKKDGDTVNTTEASVYLKNGWKATDALGNAYIIGRVGIGQMQISPATKTTLANVGVDWGAY